MAVVLLGAGLAFAGTGVTVLQAANSRFWTIFGWTLTAVGVLLLAAAFAAHVARKRRRSEPPPSPKKVGILNVGEGSESRSYGSRFGGSLDAGIVNREGGSAEDTGSTFGETQRQHRRGPEPPRRSLVQRIRDLFRRLYSKVSR